MDYATQRRKMVENQLRANKVTDEALLAAFSEIPRERFVPKGLAGIAYVDEDLQIAPSRYLTEPMILARLIQAAGVKSDEMVLDIAPATGYSTAVLARLAGTVVAVEENADLSAAANRVLNEEGIDTAVVVEGKHRDGYAKQAPYGVILINGAVQDLPRSLLDQLADGGRLITVLQEAGLGRAVLVEKIGGAFSTRVLFDAATPLLAGFARQAAFVF